MDARHFDTITKSLGTDARRRTLLKVAGAGALGSVLRLLGQRDAVAGRCPPGYDVCGGKNGPLCYTGTESCCRCRGDNFVQVGPCPSCAV
jgi:hypothetical protein